jgi:hypothetical protein
VKVDSPLVQAESQKSHRQTKQAGHFSIKDGIYFEDISYISLFEFFFTRQNTVTGVDAAVALKIYQQNMFP